MQQEDNLSFQFQSAAVFSLRDGELTPMYPDTHAAKVLNREVGWCHYQGRRDAMEDEHIATSFDLVIGEHLYPVEVYGIFDGHGGVQAAQYVKGNLVPILKETLEQLHVKLGKNDLNDEAIWNALKITFVRLKERFKEPFSGTTAVVSLILDGHLWTANTGDSRAILDSGIQLSEDAKPDDPKYQQRIENRGGIVTHPWIGPPRVNGILAVAGAIGDHNVGAITARPQITKKALEDLPENSVLILACDGVWDVASTKQVAAAVTEHKKTQAVENLAKNLVHSAFEAGSTDNLSALVVKLITSQPLTTEGTL